MSETIDWLHRPIAALNDKYRQRAIDRQNILTKPPGALGRLEEIAIQLAAQQGPICPKVDEVHITVFAGDHGVAREGVSAFPQAVTAEMVKNFANGGAAINVLARTLGATLEVINMGTITDPGPLKGVTNLQLGAGTRNLSLEAAMSADQLGRALLAGRLASQRAQIADADLFIGGEMGIGNTTSAAALACALLEEPAEKLAGPGTGLDAKGVIHKAAILQKALLLHDAYLADPLEALRRLGGFEIAALTGAYISCAQRGQPVLVDGFISSVAALCATRLEADAVNWFLFSHKSAEPGHMLVLAAMNAKPLLDLGMRLGEGSGAAVCVPLLRAACSLHAGMATFETAAISEKQT